MNVSNQPHQYININIHLLSWWRNIFSCKKCSGPKANIISNWFLIVAFSHIYICVRIVVARVRDCVTGGVCIGPEFSWKHLARSIFSRAWAADPLFVKNTATCIIHDVIFFLRCSLELAWDSYHILFIQDACLPAFRYLNVVAKTFNQDRVVTSWE